MDIQNATDLVCNISVHDAEIAALTRGVTSIICFFLCVLALIFEIVYICRQKRTNTLQRLYLYLTVSTVLYTGVLSLHVEHYFRYKNQGQFCTAIGVLDQYTGSVQLILTLGITISLIYKVIACTEFFLRIKSRFKPHGSLKKQQIGYILEAVLCTVSVVLPWTVIWVPFLSERATYGAGSGPWCWIESQDPNTCKQLERGMLEQILLWYTPFGLVAIIGLGCIVCMIVFFCYVRHKSMLKTQTRALIRDMVLLLIFLMFFCTVWLIETTIRVILNFPHMNIPDLWMVYAVITPIGGIAVPLGFFLYFTFSKVSKYASSKRNFVALEHSGMETGHQGNNLIHGPSWDTPIPSRTSDRDSKFFMTDSDRMLGPTCPLTKSSISYQSMAARSLDI